MLQPGRSYLSSTGKNPYRYGFNGKENDNEVKGEGNQQDYGMRVYDPRLGRFLSVDPITKDYPWYTPYQFAGNTPVQAIDLDGLEPKSIVTAYGDGTYRLTSPAITLVSWLSGVDEEVLANTVISNRERFPNLQWHSIKKDGGGGVTLGNRIQLTENYFEGWHQPTKWPAKPNFENGNNDEQSVNQWFNTTGHEAVHVLQWLLNNRNTPRYLEYILNGYINAFGNHDKALPEVWADKEGKDKYGDFRIFIVKAYGERVSNLFLDDKKSDQDKVKQLKKWMTEFDNLKNLKNEEERNKYIQELQKKENKESDKNGENK